MIIINNLTIVDDRESNVDRCKYYFNVASYIDIKYIDMVYNRRIIWTFSIEVFDAN